MDVHHFLVYTEMPHYDHRAPKNHKHACAGDMKHIRRKKPARPPPDDFEVLRNDALGAGDRGNYLFADSMPRNRVRV